MLILASQSKARQMLLSGTGLRFTTAAAQIDERAVETQATANAADGRAVAQLLAEAKALDVSRRHPDSPVIGADQTLVAAGRLLHKPGSIDDARAQLDQLRGITHHLHAGVALAIGGELIWSAVDTAALTMRDFAAVERDAVLALEGEAVLSSVGGYRLEGPSVRLFESIAGDYFAILGLPLLPLLAALRAHAPDVFAAGAAS